MVRAIRSASMLTGHRAEIRNSKLGNSPSVTHALMAALVVVIATGLAGCATPEQIRLADEQACAGYGFQRGTNEFANCLQREDLARRYDYGPRWYGPYYGPGPTPWWMY